MPECDDLRICASPLSSITVKKKRSAETELLMPRRLHAIWNPARGNPQPIAPLKWLASRWRRSTVEFPHVNLAALHHKGVSHAIALRLPQAPFRIYRQGREAGKDCNLPKGRLPLNQGDWPWPEFVVTDPAQHPCSLSCSRCRRAPSYPLGRGGRRTSIEPRGFADDQYQRRCNPPFTVNFPQEEIIELGRRVTATRWPDRETVPDASQGDIGDEVRAGWLTVITLDHPPIEPPGIHHPIRATVSRPPRWVHS